jgi:hypothetical protein
MAANGYLNNGGAGLRDKDLFYAVTGSDRPFDLAFAGTWGLPIGKGGVVGSNASGLRGQLLNNWDLSWILTADSGTPIGLPNGVTFNCPGHPSYLPDEGKQSYTQWLYNENNPGCFKNFPQFTPVTVIPRVSYIRGPANRPQLALSLGKKFGLWGEGKFLQIKAEVFNVTNTRIFGGPSTANPTVAPQPVRKHKTWRTRLVLRLRMHWFDSSECSKAGTAFIEVPLLSVKKLSTDYEANYAPFSVVGVCMSSSQRSIEPDSKVKG